ncbi:hypothetical protein PM082_013225 [Marasmius tenuissimus]|nr:hypothetical protein PM082_013225 [Marasmius tenuissimus]
MNLTSEERLTEVLRQWSSDPILVELYSGNLQEDAQHWLGHIDCQCDRYGIPPHQRIQVALYFMRGDVHDVFSEAVRALEEGEAMSWDDFGQTLLEMEANSRAQSSGSQDPTPNNSESDSEGQARAIPQTTEGEPRTGRSSALSPGAGDAIYNAVRLTLPGLAAGSLAAGMQSAVYGGAPSGLCLKCLSIGMIAANVPLIGFALRAGGCNCNSGAQGNGDGKARSRKIALVASAAAAVIGYVVGKRIRNRDQSAASLGPTSTTPLSGSPSPTTSGGGNTLIGGALIAGGSSVLLPSAGVATLNAVGFTSSGVAAGSLAASIQSVVYGSATSGLFSFCQSVGATAVVASPAGMALGAGAMVVGAGCLGYRWIRNGNGNS